MEQTLNCLASVAHQHHLPPEQVLDRSIPEYLKMVQQNPRVGRHSYIEHVIRKLGRPIMVNSVPTNPRRKLDDAIYPNDRPKDRQAKEAEERAYLLASPGEVVRKIPPAAPRLPYRDHQGALSFWEKKKGGSSDSCLLHWGQRKLLINEIANLTEYGHLARDVLYIGAGPGIHIKLLLAYFPDHHFHLYDKTPFQLPKHKNVTIYPQYFTRKDADEWAHFERPLILWSDIRRSKDPTGDYDSEFEGNVMEDLREQEYWVETIRPAVALLKFRFPFPDPKKPTEETSEILAGEFRIQAWSRHWSTETRLLILQPPNDTPYPRMSYSHKRYEQEMYYFNRVTRRLFYPHNIKWPGVDHCHDCALEFAILQDFLDAHPIWVEAGTKVLDISIAFTELLDPTGTRTLLDRNHGDYPWLSYIDRTFRVIGVDVKRDPPCRINYMGILVTWGLFSVPAQGGPGGSEWYLRRLKNSRRYGSATAEYHREHYQERDYYALATEFNEHARSWDPKEWIKRVRELRAGYLVITAKHTDGFSLYPTKYGPGTTRDYIGELARACTQAKIKFGISYSLGEWYNKLYDEDRRNGTSRYVDEVVHPQIKELIDRYRPYILWTDGDWEQSPEYWKATEIIGWIKKHGRTLVSNRWGRGSTLGDFTVFTGELPQNTTGCWLYAFSAIDGWGYQDPYHVKEDIAHTESVVGSRGGRTLLGIPADSYGHLIDTIGLKR